MTDELEQQVSEMLRNRVADLPASYEVAPSTVTRIRRRRATKLGALTTAVVVVIAGSAAAVAQSRGDRVRQVSTSTGPATPTTTTNATVARGTVPTKACPITYGVTPDTPLPPPATGPREVSVPGADALASYAATTDERFVSLGPPGWSCAATVGADGNSSVVLYPSGRNAPPPFADTARLSILNDWLWHGFVGVGEACKVFTDAELVSQAQGVLVCAPPVGRTVTRIDAHTATFVDADGARGAAWMLLPTAEGGDGFISVMTCRPTAGLSAGNCDAIVADWIARVGARVSPAATSTTTLPAGAVPGEGCGGAPTASGGVPPRVPAAGDPALSPGLASFLADVDGDPRFMVLGPRGWTCALNLKPTAIVVSSVPGTSWSDAPIVINEQWSWSAACSVFDDPAVVQHAPHNGPCPKAGRRVTRTAADVATFVDADGARGAAWTLLPSAATGGHGFIDVLTCRPIGGLSVAQCDTIVADYAARAHTGVAPGSG